MVFRGLAKNNQEQSAAWYPANPFQEFTQDAIHDIYIGRFLVQFTTKYLVILHMKIWIIYFHNVVELSPMPKGLKIN